MCGIAGIFNFSGRAEVQLPHVVRMADAMKHRGPDDEGYVVFQNGRKPMRFFGEDTPGPVRQAYPDMKHVQDAGDLTSIIAFGHRRLSIIDLSPGGHQPMCSADGRYWIVYNGEIYNYLELRHELKNLGHQFKSNSDTEVILAAYSEWQEDCLIRFNGDFAIAIWDNQEHSLFCARDRIGIKPFYYILEDGRFIFASDIKTLIASGLYRPEPDPQGLYLAMAFGIAPRPITAFKGIMALEQAHSMKVHFNGFLEKQRYWHIPVGTQDRSMQENDAMMLLEEKLQQAVKRRLVADVPVTSFMSGGVDSTLISAIANRLQAGFKALTIGYDLDSIEMDESRQAQATAKKNGLNHKIIIAKPEEALQHILQMMKCFEEPYYNISPGYVISKCAANEGSKVVLVGNGGDELFAGYAWYAALPKWQLANKFAKWTPWLFFLPLELPKISRFKDFCAINSADKLHTFLYKLWSDNELTELLGYSLKTESVELAIADLYSPNKLFSDNVEALSYMDIIHYIGSHFCFRLDQMTMAHSIEARFPFLDHEFVEAAFKVPSRFKINRKGQKMILKKMAAPYIAEESISMKKKGFGLPLKHWMRNHLNEFVSQNIKELKISGLVNEQRVDKVFTDYNENNASGNSYLKVWHLISLNIWLKNIIF